MILVVVTRRYPPHGAAHTKGTAEPYRARTVQAAESEHSKLKLDPLRHPQPMEVTEQRRDVLKLPRRAHESRRCIHHRLQPVKLSSRQTGQSGVTIVEARQYQ